MVEGTESHPDQGASPTGAARGSGATGEGICWNPSQPLPGTLREGRGHALPLSCLWPTPLPGVPPHEPSAPTPSAKQQMSERTRAGQGWEGRSGVTGRATAGLQEAALGSKHSL